MFSYKLHLERLGRRRSSRCCVALAIGFFNGYLVMQDQDPQLLDHVGHVLDAAPASTSRVTKLITGRSPPRASSDMRGLRLGARRSSRRRSTIGGVDDPDHRVVVAAVRRDRHLGAVPDPDRQLDLRRRRRPGARPRGRRAGDRGEDRAVHVRRRSAPGSPACTCCSRSTRCSPVRASATSSSTSSPRSIGGCLLTGGYGSAIGAAIGAFIFGMTNQGIVYAGWNPDWFKFFLGVMLLLAVAGQPRTSSNYAATREVEPTP